MLDLAAQLELTADQKAATEALFKRMQSRAIALDEALARIAALQGELRAVHLGTHLAQASILTPAQMQSYNKLRGYDAGSSEHTGHMH